MTITLTSPSTSIETATFSNDTVSYTFDASGWRKRVTPILKEGREIGKIHMHGWSKDEVVVNGRNVEMVLKSRLSVKKYFAASNGQTYTWKASYGDEAHLKDTEDRIVAQYIKGSSGYLGRAKDSTLDIADALEPVMDEVFVTFVYIVQEARVRTIAASA